MKSNSDLKKDMMSYSTSGDIRPTPTVVKSLKVPHTEVSDIRNNVVLIRAKKRKYCCQVSVPYSNH